MSTSNTVIVPAQEALSADTRQSSAATHRWIEAKRTRPRPAKPAGNNSRVHRVVLKRGPWPCPTACFGEERARVAERRLLLNRALRVGRVHATTCRAGVADRAGARMRSRCVARWKRRSCAVPVGTLDGCDVGRRSTLEPRSPRLAGSSADQRRRADHPRQGGTGRR